MDIITNRQGRALVLSVSGRLDATTADTLARPLNEAIEAGEKRVVVDLSGIDFVGSAGLRVFIVAEKQCKAHGGQLRLCGLSGPIRMVFNAAGLSLRLEICKTLDDAIKEG